MHTDTAQIRAERAGDEAAVAAVVERAFADHPFSDHTETSIVAALREAGALAISLVADAAGTIVGHVAASPVTVGDGAAGWYGLGPVAVAPERQRQGIGRALVETTLQRLRDAGAAGCVVVGESAYYGRFGFASHPALVLPGVPPQFFMALSFSDAWPEGTVAYHPAFAGGT